MAHSLPIARSAFLPDEPRGRVAKATIRMGSYVGFIKIASAVHSALAPVPLYLLCALAREQVLL